MLTETQDDRYFERMASSLGDKTRVLPHVLPGRVLDVGAGGGELAEYLRIHGHEVWALDGSAAAISRMASTYPELNLIRGLAHEVNVIEPELKFSTIVCSSIFHEVYSYGTPETGPYSIRALQLTLTHLFQALEPGGRLIIRDGIMPTEWNKPVKIKLKDPADGDAFVEKYKANAPFAHWGPGKRSVQLEREAPGLYRCNLASAMEFLYTYTWGWQSSDREMKELYGLFPEEEYRQFVADVGFEVEESFQYLQEGYPQFLEPKAAIAPVKNGGANFMGPTEWPSSNFILVAHRPKD